MTSLPLIERASTAPLRSPASRWMYLAVVVLQRCPSTAPILGPLTPARANIVAQVCRSMYGVNFGSPASRAKALNGLRNARRG